MTCNLRHPMDLRHPVSTNVAIQCSIYVLSLTNLVMYSLCLSSSDLFCISTNLANQCSISVLSQFILRSNLYIYHLAIYSVFYIYQSSDLFCIPTNLAIKCSISVLSLSILRSILYIYQSSNLFCVLYLSIQRCILYIYQSSHGSTSMGWLRFVGSSKLQVSFAEYCLFYRALLQKRPIILRRLLILATPYQSSDLFCIHLHQSIDRFYISVIQRSILISISTALECHSMSVLQVSFATFRLKETNEIEIGD